MNDKAGHMTTKGDAGLRHAAALREAKLPQKPDTLDSMVMERVAKPCRRRRMLRLVCGTAASAAIIAALGVAKWTSAPYENRHAAAEAPTAAEPKPALFATSSTQAISATQATQAHTTKETNDRETKAKAYAPPAKPQPSDSSDTGTTQAGIMPTYQKQVSDYIARLSRTYHAEAIPVDCRTGGSNTVYVFGDNDGQDVFEKLCMMAMWIDTDTPGVRMSFDQSQLTLELNAASQPGGTDQLWLADRRGGRIYLYHSQSDTDAWQQSACYTAFIGQDGRKTEN